MKRIAFALAVLTVLTVVFAAFSVNAAGPLDSFTEVEKPAASTVRKTSYRFARVWGVENPVGRWSPDDYQTDIFRSNGTYVDANNATIILWYNDYDRRTLTELVFADLFSSTGAGDYGPSRVTPEIWDKVTLVVSDDFLNWREVGFTVAYHTEAAATVQNQYLQDVRVDLYWHLILDEVTTAKYFAIHGGEAKAWDDTNHIPRLGIFMDENFYYGVNTSGREDVDFDDVRYLYINEAHAEGTVQSVTENADGTLTLGGIVPQTTPIWHTYVFDGATKNFPYISYTSPVSANEMVIADRSGWADESKTAPKYTDYEDLEIYYADEMTGTWTKIETTVVPYNCQQELRGGWAQGFRFQFEETVTAKCFLLYDPNPQANELQVTGNTFYAVYEPTNGTAPRPETQAPVITDAPETEAPETETSETTEASESTEAPAVTGAAVTTEASETAEIAEDSSERNMTWLWVVIAVSAVVVVAVVVTGKKKK